jgi:hypothetical protein
VRLDGFEGIYLIGILDPQEELAPRLFGKEKVEQCGP